MDINWDQIAYEADNSPKSLLLELLEDADSYDCLVAVISKKNEDGSESVQCSSSGSGLTVYTLSKYGEIFFRSHLGVDNG